MTTEEDLQLWRAAFAERMDKFERRLDDNAEATKRIEANTSQIVEIFESWKGAMKVLEFLGKLAKPVAAIGAAIGAWFMFKGGK